MVLIKAGGVSERWRRWVGRWLCGGGLTVGFVG